MNRPGCLILITVDCFRADHAGFLGYHRNTTPFLDSLAKSSMVFSNAIVAGAPTYYSFPSIMASRYPLAGGRDLVGIAPDEPTIASALRDSGYATAAFLAANPYLSPRFGYDAGFDRFRDFLDDSAARSSETISDGTNPSHKSKLNSFLDRACHSLGPLGGVYDELYYQYCQVVANRTPSSLESLRRFPSADVIVNEAVAWLESVDDNPFFMWLHFMDPHSPYYPKEEALRWMEDDLDAAQARAANSYWNRGDIKTDRLRSHRGAVTALYDAGIRWVDVQIGRLVEHLRQREMWDDCVLAVTADHGEEFLEHGGRYHSPAKLVEELIHVPLMLHGRGCQPGALAEPFSLIDLAPTLFAALNIPSPDSFRGTSLQERTNMNHAITESVAACKNPFAAEQRVGPRNLAIREATYKLVLDFTSSKSSLFDLRNDPAEIHPLAQDCEKPVRRRLLEAAREHIGRSMTSHDPGHRLDAILRNLRIELGEPVSDVSV